MTERKTDAEILADALEKAAEPHYAHYAHCDGDSIVIDGTYNATAVLAAIREALAAGSAGEGI